MCHHGEPAFNSRTMLCMLSPSQGLTVQQLLQTDPFPPLKQLIKKKKYPHTAGNYKTLQEPAMPRTFIRRHTSVPSALEADLFQKSFYRRSRKDGYGHSPSSMSDYILKGYSLSLKIPILLKNSNPSLWWVKKKTHHKRTSPCAYVSVLAVYIQTFHCKLRLSCLLPTETCGFGFMRLITGLL